ncbi:uncharacterized protein PSFLO_00304 [Pseudozyma flocculosa]|uniref:Uncharacterized protein n=1 Tax=Pseudozyma flocculosa TaxID=84751 RepID=A0A5C3ER84_9BASI|nr:uncharacterized protein PSFLO_00304 [Pseudozyma flocculosa]
MPDAARPSKLARRRVRGPHCCSVSAAIPSTDTCLAAPDTAHVASRVHIPFARASSRLFRFLARSRSSSRGSSSPPPKGKGQRDQTSVSLIPLRRTRCRSPPASCVRLSFPLEPLPSSAPHSYAPVSDAPPRPSLCALSPLITRTTASSALFFACTLFPPPPLLDPDDDDDDQHQHHRSRDGSTTSNAEIPSSSIITASSSPNAKASHRISPPPTLPPPPPGRHQSIAIFFVLSAGLPTGPYAVSRRAIVRFDEAM